MFWEKNAGGWREGTSLPEDRVGGGKREEGGRGVKPQRGVHKVTRGAETSPRGQPQCSVLARIHKTQDILL